MKSAMCDLCAVNHKNQVEADFLAPQEVEQIDEGMRSWNYIPVCELHCSCWWEGSDVPDYERPPIFVISSGVAVPI